MAVGTRVRDTIGNYRLIEFLGAGGMGEVYRGVHVRNGSIMAVKILTAVDRLPSLAERFRNEARIQSLLQHPNIAHLEEFLEHDGTPCIVMEYVDGETLEQRVHRRGALPQEEALSITASVVDAVGYLHERGIIHRDIKPSNVKIAESGIVKLLDFGIAKGPGSPALTTQGSVIGTLQSLAPEQLAGAPASRLTDVWALGVLLYELATGRHPFAQGGPDEITTRIRGAQFTQPSRANENLTPAMDRIIGRCLRMSPRERYPSCDALLADILPQLQPVPLAGAPSRPGPNPLEQVKETVRTLRPRVPLILSVSAVLLVLFVLVTSLPGRPSVAGTHPPAPLPADPVSVREVTINAIAGIAEVWKDGRKISETPYLIRGPIGQHISLVLRREGYEDEPVKFDITEGRSEYSVTMHPQPANGGRSPLPPEDLPMLPALAWFGLPWRRRKTKPAPLSLTVDRPLPDPAVRAAESRMIVGVASDPGCVRDSNEDTIRVVRPANESSRGQGLLAAVLDGMGGHAAGEVASRIAADELAAHYGDTPDDPGESLAGAVRAANKAVFSAASADPALKGMGTTCTALVIRGGMAWCAHVGDSRCYLVRGDEIFLMTEDHSAVMAMVRNGALSRDEARQHPDKNVISRALGSHSQVEVTIWPRPFVLNPGDRFLLCSDGLHDLASDEDVRQIVKAHPPHLACEHLVALARERGAPDNVSAIVLAMPETGSDSLRTTRELQVPA